MPFGAAECNYQFYMAMISKYGKSCVSSIEIFCNYIPRSYSSELWRGKPTPNIVIIALDKDIFNNYSSYFRIVALRTLPNASVVLRACPRQASLSATRFPLQIHRTITHASRNAALRIRMSMRPKGCSVLCRHNDSSSTRA